MLRRHGKQPWLQLINIKFFGKFEADLREHAPDSANAAENTGFVLLDLLFFFDVLLRSFCASVRVPLFLFQHLGLFALSERLVVIREFGQAPTAWPQSSPFLAQDLVKSPACWPSIEPQVPPSRHRLHGSHQVLHRGICARSTANTAVAAHRELQHLQHQLKIQVDAHNLESLDLVIRGGLHA